MAGAAAASKTVRAAEPAWVAVASPTVDGVAPLAEVLADLVDATRTADQVGRRGWVPDPAGLAIERLLLENRDLGDVAVGHELGPLLADERLGPELVETLQVYFDSGENMREAARRLHLANRTVAYRLEKIESLLGGPLDDASRRKLAVALLVRRLRGGTG
jgi:DNA-binding PucR family transcriptional regulator